MSNKNPFSRPTPPSFLSLEFLHCVEPLEPRLSSQSQREGKGGEREGKGGGRRKRERKTEREGGRKRERERGRML